jgi:hypothetical protein
LIASGLQQPVAGRGDDDQLVRIEDLRLKVTGPGVPFGEAKLDGAFLERPPDPRGVRHLDPELDRREPPVELRQHPGQEVAADRLAGADCQAPALQAAVLADRPDRVGLDPQPAPGVLGEDDPGLGQPAAAGQAVEEADPQLLLQVGNLPRDRRLADPGRRGAATHAAGGGHRLEEGKVIAVHDILIRHGFHIHNVFVACQRIRYPGAC